MTCVNLSGPCWRLRKSGAAASISACVPGDNYSALEAAGDIPDPYWRQNEELVQWVADEDWIFEREFEVPDRLLEHRSVFLNLDGVDTVAVVRLNGQTVGRPDNMFLRWRFEVKSSLRPGRNTLEVAIRSPRRAGEEADARVVRHLPGYHNFGSVYFLNLLRKCQCSGGWDWGLSLPASGLFGRIYLKGVGAARLEHVYHTQEFEAGGAVVVKVYAELSRIVRNCPVKIIFAFGTQQQEVLADGECATALFRVERPRLWWPNGYGEQTLYDLRVAVDGQEVRQRIGLRRLEVLRGAEGFGFRVNGVDIFAKGANWVPADARPQHATREKVEHLLASAAIAGMNCIRVWGGGRYEDDFFYDYCDAHGLLVWQDFMFACSLYPSDQWFLDSVRAEAEWQVKRLRHHASLALWCGDNEVLGLMTHMRAKPEFEQWYADFDRLHQVLAHVVAQCDPERVFWLSSPCDGEDVRNDVDDPSRGDLHFWKVWGEDCDHTAFYQVRPRFCSEFGYESLPGMATVRGFSEPQDWNLFSSVMEFHQRSLDRHGNSKIIALAGRYCRMPKNFEQMTYISQLVQARVLRKGVEYWHTLPDCRGALFWQLNDNWPVSSYSAIDFGGRWKILQYEARHFYAPVQTVLCQTAPDEPLRAFLLSDLPRTFDAQVTVTLRRLDTGAELAHWEFRVPCAGQGVTPLELPDLVHDATARGGLAPETCFVMTETDAFSSGERVCRAHRDTVFLESPKRCELPKPSIQVEAVEQGDGENSLVVTLSTDRPAYFVWLADSGDAPAEFGDNLLTLLPGRTLVEYRRWHGRTASPDELRRNLTVYDLANSYE